MAYIFFFFNDTATTDIYTLSLHDALPICGTACIKGRLNTPPSTLTLATRGSDRKSTRLNSSHLGISYAVFCLKKKKGGAAHRAHGDLHYLAISDEPPPTLTCIITALLRVK